MYDNSRIYENRKRPGKESKQAKAEEIDYSNLKLDLSLHQKSTTFIHNAWPKRAEGYGNDPKKESFMFFKHYDITYFLSKIHFDTPGYFDEYYRQVPRESTYFFNVVHDKSGKKSMYMRIGGIQSAFVDEDKLYSNEKVMVTTQQIILLPSDHKDARNEKVTYTGVEKGT
jgi:hypothetical protein